MVKDKETGARDFKIVKVGRLLVFTQEAVGNH